METRIISGLTALLLLTLSCTGIDREPEPESRGEMVTLSWSPGEDSPTRSSFTGGEAKVKSYVIAAYRKDDGSLADCASVSSGAAATLSVYSGATYVIMVAANLGLGVGDIPETLSGMRNLTCAIPSYGNSGIFPKGLPMAGYTEKAVTGSGDISGEVSLARLVSKYTFTFKDGGVDGKPSTTGDDLGYKVKSVKLLQTAKKCAPFSETGFAASSSSDILAGGDKASSADVTTLASGGKAVFYVPENMQGQYGITGEWDKAFDNPVLSGVRDRLTYLEVSLSFPSDNAWGITGDVTYRICLGDNVVNDFNIRRNASYEVVMTGTAKGLGVDSWRVEDGSSKPEMGASFTGGDYLARKGTLTVTGWSSMSTAMRNSVSVVPSDASAFTVTSSGNGKYSIVPIKTGSYTIKVTGILHSPLEIPVSVSAPVLVLNASTFTVTPDSGASVKASFKDSEGNAITNFDATAYSALLKPSLSFKTLGNVMDISVISEGSAASAWKITEGSDYLPLPPSTPNKNLGSFHDLTFTDLTASSLDCLLADTDLRIGTVTYSGEVIAKCPSSEVTAVKANLKAKAEASFKAKLDGKDYDGLAFSSSYKVGQGCTVTVKAQSCLNREAGSMTLWFVKGSSEVCVGKFDCHVHATVRCHHQYNVNVITSSDNYGFDPAAVPVSGLGIDSGTTSDASSYLSPFAHCPFWFIYFYIDGGDTYNHATYYAGAAGSGTISPPRYSKVLYDIQLASGGNHKWEGALVKAETVSTVSNSSEGYTIFCPYEVLPFGKPEDGALYRYMRTATASLTIRNLFQPILAVSTTTEYVSSTGQNRFVNYKTPLGGLTATLGDPDGSGTACSKETYNGEKVIRMQGANSAGTFDGKKASDGKGYWWLHATAETYSLYSRSTTSNPDTGETYRFIEVK